MAQYRCLVVEDSPMMRQLLVFALQRVREVEVVEADDGVDGLRKLAGTKFDIIITDINMPIMDGLKLVKRVRNEGVTEIVMGTNPTLEGDGTALYISNLLANDNVRITRLARGIASGSVLEFANRELLADALRGRQDF